MNESTSQSAVRRLYIVGAGGFGREVAWLASESLPGKELHFVVDSPDFLKDEVDGIPVDLMASLKPQSDAQFVVAVGNPSQRRLLAEKMECAGFSPGRLMHTGTRLSSRVELGDGVIVTAGNILTTGIRIGDHVHINLACTVGHDVSIGSFTTLSPGVHISGNVLIGQEVFIGTGAVIVNGTSGCPLNVGDRAVIAAGACVTRSVAPGAMVAGVPAERKR